MTVVTFVEDCPPVRMVRRWTPGNTARTPIIVAFTDAGIDRTLEPTHDDVLARKRKENRGDNVVTRIGFERE